MRGALAIFALAALAGCAGFWPAAGSAVVGAGAAAVLAPSCAPPPPAHWPMCRDSCAKKGAIAARIDGSVKADELPACLCGFPPEPT